MTRLVVAALWGIFALGGPSSILAAQEAPSSIGPERVPFVGQTPLLCGGAAAAMVERFWGARAVYGDDYAHLVQEERGGIAASDLRDALRRKGYDVRVSTGDPEAAFRMLTRGVPPILLLSGGEPALHYVVLVDADAKSTWIHDPNFGPAQRIERRELVARWGGSNFLALEARPSPARGAGGGSHGPIPVPGPGGSAGPATDGALPSTIAPAVDSAMAFLRAGDTEGARRLAEPVVHEDERSPALARRILATAVYTGGDRLGALDHWNDLSEPVIDLVEVRGTPGVRHHVLLARLDLHPRTLLTADDLRLARRRLEAVPAVETSRVDYRPLSDGSVQVRAVAVQERPWPGLRDGMTVAAQAAVDDAIDLSVGPLFPGGDRLALQLGWSEAQRLAGAVFATAGEDLPGIVRVRLDWRRERHPSSSDPLSTEVEERVRGGMELDEWVAPSVALRLGAGMERWRRGLRKADAVEPSSSARVGFGALAATWSPARGSGVRVSGTLWVGAETRFAAAALEMFGRIPLGTGSRISARAVVSTTTSGAPRMVWHGAGTGELRTGLLRGHPLASDGVIRGAGFGPHIVSGTVEARRALLRFGPLQAGGAIFVDAARVWPAGPSGRPRNLVDPGAGLFASTGEREIRLDAARGDERWVVSARVSLPPPA